jgi:hypothetical protein
MRGRAGCRASRSPDAEHFQMKHLFQRQRLLEDRIDIVVAAAVLVATITAAATLRHTPLFIVLAIIGAFWVRWNYVRVRRDQNSLEAEIAAGSRFGTAPDHSGQRRIGTPH